MTTRAGQGATQSRYDPLVEVLLKELIDETPQPKAGKKNITDVLAEELLASLKEAESITPQEVSLETVIVAEALAPALAKALADALAPALIKALNNLISTSKKAPQTTSKRSSD
ncbi:MAG: hypothetical protein J2P37_16915 [Ktedonobacteraceae bacterium]|nr:hypothetical protein [Ktedonobacteraceae bacterium]